MGRIANIYELKLRALFRRKGVTEVETALREFLDKAECLAKRDNISKEKALTKTYGEMLASNPPEKREVQGFLCDAGLGGLARWLRAAGYIALWEPSIEDEALLKHAQQLGYVLLTTDSIMMERRVLRDGQLPSCWVPPTLRAPEQLRLVFSELGLEIKPPRCMHCGGRLVRGDKEALRDRIPPRTYRWLDEYFLCADCGQLFWHGTHWSRIRAAVAGAAASGTRPRSSDRQPA